MAYLRSRRLSIVLLAILLVDSAGAAGAAWAQELAAVPITETRPQRTATPKERWVFLVHGLLMTRGSMQYLDERLSEAGYKTVNFGYASRSLTLQQAGEELQQSIADVRTHHPDIEVNLVTHSMGGIIARYYLTRYTPEDFGALIQIAPPNKGAEKADIFADYIFYRLLYGRNGLQLQTDRTDVQKLVGYPKCTIGIIAGGTGDNEGFSELIEGDDDGTVSVDHTMLPDMTDHIVLRHTHAFIMRKREVADQVIHFFSRGRFKRDDGVLYPPVPGTIAAAE